jgi:hypothetical protein
LLVGDYFSSGLGSHRGKEPTKNCVTVTTVAVPPSAPRSAGQSTAGVMESRPETRILSRIRLAGDGYGSVD